MRRSTTSSKVQLIFKAVALIRRPALKRSPMLQTMSNFQCNPESSLFMQKARKSKLECSQGMLVSDVLLSFYVDWLLK